MEKMRSNGNIQIIECDPPYGIDLNDQKASKSSVDSNVHSYEEVPRESYPAFLATLTKELYRVAGKDCWLVFWFGPTWHQLVLDCLRDAGWVVDEIPAVWTKNQGQTLQPEYYFARAYEPFFLCRKGKPVMVERGRLNVFNFAGVPGKAKYHPTQRPTELIKEIFTTLGAGRQHVFVPFLGSGATLLTCYELGYDGFGFDLNPEYKDKFLLAVEDQTRKLFSTNNE
jgi:DNA modification methylase